MTKTPLHRVFLLALVTALLLMACTDQWGETNSGRLRMPRVAGDAEAGRRAIAQYGCGSCHVIPGVPGANAYVGPPLNNWSQRMYIAGNLFNDAENLIFWLQYPQEVEPGTAMPNLNVTREDAEHIAAYLFSLGRSD
jgi:cytochrome c2